LEKELNPKVSSFKDVQAATKIIEIAYSVSIGWDKCQTCKDKGPTVEVSSISTMIKSNLKSDIPNEILSETNT
jgi:hypothetical protein